MGILRARVGGQWVDIGAGGSMPIGGTTGQLLAKSSAADYATSWVNPAAVTDPAIDLSGRGVLSLTRKSGNSVFNVNTQLITAPNATYAANRRFRFGIELFVHSSATGFYGIYLGDTVAGLYHRRWLWSAPAADVYMPLHCEYIPSSSLGGSRTWAVFMARENGTGNATVFDGGVASNATPTSAGYGSHLLIEDIGPV